MKSFHLMFQVFVCLWVHIKQFFFIINFEFVYRLETALIQKASKNHFLSSKYVTVKSIRSFLFKSNWIAFVCFVILYIQSTRAIILIIYFTIILYSIFCLLFHPYFSFCVCVRMWVYVFITSIHIRMAWSDIIPYLQFCLII